MDVYAAWSHWMQGNTDEQSEGDQIFNVNLQETFDKMMLSQKKAQEKIASLEEEKAKFQQDIETLQDQREEQRQENHNLKQQVDFFKAKNQKEEAARYSMGHKSNGVAIIINNINFRAKFTKRVGAEHDTKKLETTFQMLGLKVKFHTDLTVSEMIHVLNEEASQDHTHHNLFLCCIMSHGHQGKVYGTDGIGLDILELTNLFKGDECKSLLGKPKLFFVQACQGDKIQDKQTKADAVPGGSPSAIVAYMTAEADFFLSLATVPGCKALRNELTGAYYVTILSDVLTKGGSSQSLMSLMVEVNDKMSEMHGQCPFWCGTLTKKLYLVNKKDQLTCSTCMLEIAQQEVDTGLPPEWEVVTNESLEMELSSSGEYSR
ncbi:caspase-3-like [Branchiostoma floridae]|uniref:Caspase-3-like n=1 Tax=Branchiostoma floridae TaxID=7739 RepID=A0A9J7MBG5_BRAFL|nr:caspase-3-like [Branchiostoma floridae]